MQDYIVGRLAAERQAAFVREAERDELVAQAHATERGRRLPSADGLRMGHPTARGILAVLRRRAGWRVRVGGHP